jgi:hypothetical protein
MREYKRFQVVGAPFFVIVTIFTRKGVKQDEEDHEQESPGQRGSLLERHEKNGEIESWYGMSQMKGLKELNRCWSATEPKTADMAASVLLVFFSGPRHIRSSF